MTLLRAWLAAGHSLDDFAHLSANATLNVTLHHLSKRRPLTLAEVGYQANPTQLDVVPSLGAEAIGIWVSQMFLGFNLVAFIRYFSNFQKDHWSMKSLVALLWVLDMLQSAIYLDIFWFWIIECWGNVAALNVLTWSFFVDVAMTGTIPMLVQHYFVYRVWVISNKKARLVPAIIVFLSLLQWSWSIATVPIVWKLGVPANIPQYVWGVSVWFSSAAAADAVITVSMLYYILKARGQTGFQRTRKLLDKLIILVFETNAVTSLGVLSILFVFVFTSSKTLAYNALTYVVTKIYTLSLLLAANSRIALREQMFNPTNSGSMVNRRGGGEGGMEVGGQSLFNQTGLRSDVQTMQKKMDPRFTDKVQVSHMTTIESEEAALGFRIDDDRQPRVSKKAYFKGEETTISSDFD